MAGETPQFTLRSHATVADALRHGATLLRAARIDGAAALEARLLLAAALGETVEDLLKERRRVVPMAAYAALLAQRAAHVPLAFLLGEREFWSLAFEVSPATLIPRPDSETLIEAALRARPARDAGRVLDLGTGTGCLLLAALHEFRGAWGVGIDLNPGAALLAARNATRLGLAERAAFLCGHWASAVEGRFDLVLCNPPYVESAAIVGLMPEVARHEPRAALDGGPDGLDAYRAILPDLPRLLAPGGLALLELGAGQADAVSALAGQAGFTAATTRDLAGIERALALSLPP